MKRSAVSRASLTGTVALALTGASLPFATAATAVPATPAATPALSPAAVGAALNVHVVRFAKGTSPAAMRAAVQAAGGEVQTDLSGLGRLAVTSDNPAFRQAMRAQAGVEAVWADKLVSIPTRDAAAGGASQAAPSGTSATIPDPWHDLDTFWGENAPGVLQWDDDRNGARKAWNTTWGDPSVRVAVIDTGVDFSHPELRDVVDKQLFANTIPCNLLTSVFGPKLGQRDCSMTDTEGHGTWVASRIAGAVNGFASNGVAPKSRIVGYKALSTTLGGGLTSWIVDGMYRACNSGSDIINMSLGGYNKLGADDEDTLMWVDAVNYCRAKGTAILASAGNDHVRINRVDLTVGDRALKGVGQVTATPEGVALMAPGSNLATYDYRGMIETPAGIPGVIMVSAANNANGPAGAALNHLASKPTEGKQDQLTYYSSYGARVDITAPGGARKYNVPRYDGGAGDILYGGWGTLGALTKNGEICQDPALSSPLTFACFTVNGAAFGWLQGTSMSAPNASGVAALILAAKPRLQGNPDGLLRAMQSTARKDMVNETGPTDPADRGPSASGAACTQGWCHVDFYKDGVNNPITFADAYGAGMANAEGGVG